MLGSGQGRLAFDLWDESQKAVKSSIPPQCLTLRKVVLKVYAVGKLPK